jgi:putative membrane protein
LTFDPGPHTAQDAHTRLGGPATVPSPIPPSVWEKVSEMMWYGNGMGGWGYALMTVSSVLWWALIIAGVIALIRYIRRGRSPLAQRADATSTTPGQVLGQRFAAGEIDEQEYRQRLEVPRDAGHPLANQ